MCECIATTNALLQAQCGAQVGVVMTSDHSRPPRAVLHIRRRFSRDRTEAQGLTHLFAFVACHCPMCGERYGADALIPEGMPFPLSLNTPDPLDGAYGAVQRFRGPTKGVRS